MKNARTRIKKFLSTILVVSMVFSLFSGIMIVEAAEVRSIIYERTTENTLIGPKITDKLTIYGRGFEDPKVFAGINATKSMVVNTGLSTAEEIVIDDPYSLALMAGRINDIEILNNGTDMVGSAIIYDLSKIPTITTASKSKVFLGESLDIDGLFFDGLVEDKDKLFISGTEYELGTEATIDTAENSISVATVKSPVFLGVNDIRIERNFGTLGEHQIISTLKSSIKVVDRLTGIDVERVDPNTGPNNKRNLVNIYGKEGFAEFDNSMRIFVNGNEGTNKGIIEDADGEVVGLSVELPTSNTVGSANILITNNMGDSEFEIVNAFIYLSIGNTLSINPDGITPNFKKETEYKDITIVGRNIGYFDGLNYNNLTGVVPEDYEPLGYVGYDILTNLDTYKVKYTGLYNGVAATIIREISVFINDAAPIKGPQIVAPSFTKSRDTIVVNPAEVNLEIKQPKDVDVKILTTTTVFDEVSNKIHYSRKEEYTVNNGFQYIPNEITPSITTVTPEFGPSDMDIYMTIMGKDFEVLEDGTTPTVLIGEEIIEGKETVLIEGVSTLVNKVKVYDNENREVDGKMITLGTKLKIKLPKAASEISGATNVTVINPSDAQYTKINGFEYRNPSTRPEIKFPSITSIKESYGDLRGGAVSGEKVLITGENFDVTLDNKIIITIDGEKAVIDGKVSADGKTVTIIPPPGTLPGKTMLQLINEDGSMAEAAFEYKRIITAPRITKIVPTKGGKGTKLVIKGEDFMLPDGSVTPDDPKRKGTVVLINGKELNAYNYLSSGTITDPTDNPDRGIYYYGSFDPDGIGPMAAFQLDGKMITVVDSTTIYVDIPENFYSYKELPLASPYLKSEPIPMGDLTVQVLNPDGAKSKENVLFTFLKPGTSPTIASITPANGAVDGGTVVKIIGTNFRQDDLKVYFGSELVTDLEYINTQEIIVKVPIYPYTIPEGKDNIFVPVMVMNYDGAMGVYDKPGFEYRIPGSRPFIESLSPARGSAAGGEEIIIRGRDFRRKEDGTSEPKVYFNGMEAKVTWVGNGAVNELLIVETPPSKKDGAVDIVIANYDSGAYTYKSFTYEISKPSISSVTPNVIAKQGGAKLQINGTGFKNGDLEKLLDGEQVDRHLGAGKPAADQIDNLVIFGDESTGDKKIINTVLGPLSTVINELKFDYTSLDINTARISLSKVVGTTVTPIRSIDIPKGSSHMFIVNGKEDLGDETLGDEGVLVEITPNQAIITRRVAAYAKWENDGLQITAISPAVGSIGNRNMYVQNMDGGSTTWDIEVLNPSSTPEITYISPRNKVKRAGGIIDYSVENLELDEEYYTYTPLDGGAFITINGSDFRRNVKVYMGNKELEIVSRSVNDNQLLVKVPVGAADDLDKLYRILVVNEDGATADSSRISKPHYIVYKMPESNPIVEKVTPESTSSQGQNTIRIVGDDFREGIQVLIDGIPCTNVTLISYKELTVKVPLGLTPGKKLIQVINTDYGFGEKADAVTIISSPEIQGVYDELKDDKLDPVLLSIDGGQIIRLEGKDYLSGVKVILGGTLKTKAELKAGETGIPCFNKRDVEMVIVGGVDATDIKVENSTVLTFTTPKLNVGDISIIVVNSDGGISNEVNASYQKPYPDAPTDLEVEVVDSDTIKLEWDKIPGTNHYEIYASNTSSKDYEDYVYVGSVKAYEVSEGNLRYYVDGLKASSWYSFKLKSVNDYGPSKFSDETSYVKTKSKKITTYYKVEGDYEGGIPQNDKIDILGNSLTFIAGESSLSNHGNGMIVNFNQVNYVAYDPKNADISIELLRKYPNNSITIKEKDFTLKMLGKSLLVNETKAVSNDKLFDSKMTVSVVKNLKAKGDEIRLKVPKGYKAITAPAAINTTMQVEKTKTSIKILNGNAQIIFNVSDPIKKLYPGGIFIAYYNNTTKKLEILSAKVVGTTIVAQITKPGEYMLLGKFIR